MTVELYFMAVEVESFLNRKHNVVTGGLMTLRASNQVILRVVVSYLRDDVFYYIIATSYVKNCDFTAAHRK